MSVRPSAGASAASPSKWTLCDPPALVQWTVSPTATSVDGGENVEPAVVTSLVVAAWASAGTASRRASGSNRAVRMPASLSPPDGRVHHRVDDVDHEVRADHHHRRGERHALQQ